MPITIRPFRRSPLLLVEVLIRAHTYEYSSKVVDVVFGG